MGPVTTVVYSDLYSSQVGVVSSPGMTSLRLPCGRCADPTRKFGIDVEMTPAGVATPNSYLKVIPLSVSDSLGFKTLPPPRRDLTTARSQAQVNRMNELGRHTHRP